MQTMANPDKVQVSYCSCDAHKQLPTGLEQFFNFIPCQRLPGLGLFCFIATAPPCLQETDGRLLFITIMNYCNPFYWQSNILCCLI